MKYDVDDVLKEVYNDETPKPNFVLNQITLQKIKDVNESRSSVKYRIKRFAQLAVLCISICLLMTVSVPAFTAVVTYIKEVVDGDKKQSEEETTARVYDYSEGTTEWKIEEGVLIISGTGNMEYDKVEEWKKIKSEIKEVVIKDGVTDINWNAFGECSELESVYMADSVTCIDSYAFENCVKLKMVKMSKNVKYIDSGAFSGCSSLLEVQLPEGLLEIGAWAFSDCISLQEVLIPNSVLNIRRGAFENCSNLQYVKMPANIQQLGEAVFEGTKWIGNEEINEHNLVIDGNVLISGRDATGYVIIPDYVDIISESVFENSKIERIIIPENITRIEMCMFMSCTELKGIVFEGSVEKIDWYAFYDCDSLESVRLPEGLVEISDGAFEGCDNLTSIYLPESLEKVGMGIFSDCDKLTTIYGKKGSLAEKLARYGDYEFIEE